MGDGVAAFLQWHSQQLSHPASVPCIQRTLYWGEKGIMGVWFLSFLIPVSSAGLFADLFFLFFFFFPWKSISRFSNSSAWVAQRRAVHLAPRFTLFV